MALTIAVGFVVDDAIVMIENIVRHIEKGKTYHRDHPLDWHRQEEWHHAGWLPAGRAARAPLSTEEAIHEACRLRFRPILMTTMGALLGASR
jgi:multidrug efflux pump subunit AcrB